MKSLSRRAFLKTIGQAGLICAAPDFARAVQSVNPDTVCISILHTTDLHGHILPTIDYDRNPDLGGFARCATQIRRWRRKNPNTILIDLGDVYQGTDVALRTKGALMIDLFNYLKYDAWILGNHEFDWGIETFSDALQRSTMPVLAANTLIEGKTSAELSDMQNPFAKISAYILKEISGIKIAIIGIYLSRESRSLVGFNIASEGRGSERRITSLTRDDGQLLERDKKYRIAFNMFDSRSGGHRFMKLRDFLETPAANCTLHPVQTRDALIEYFQRHKVVHRIPRPGPVPIAA